jgi:hypothetical protein
VIFGSFRYRFFLSPKIAGKRSPTPNLLYLYYVKVIKFSMITNTNTQMKTNQYPFAQELITDTQGNTALPAAMRYILKAESTVGDRSFYLTE